MRQSSQTAVTPAEKKLKQSEIKQELKNVYEEEKIPLTFKPPRTLYFNWKQDLSKQEPISGMIEDMTKDTGSGDIGSGLYVSTNPFDSQYYGRVLYVIRLEQELAFHQLEEDHKTKDEKIKKQKRLKYLGEIEPKMFTQLKKEGKSEVLLIGDAYNKTWLKIHSHFGVKNIKKLFTIKKFMDIKDLASFGNLPPDIIYQNINLRSLFSSMHHPKDKVPKSILSFSPHDSKYFRNHAPCMPESMPPALQELKANLPPMQLEILAEDIDNLSSGSRIFDLFAAQKFQHSLTDITHFITGKDFPISKDPFLFNLMWSFSFIDYYDLLLELAREPAKNNTEPWRLYEQRKDKPEKPKHADNSHLTQWIKAIRIGQQYHEIIDREDSEQMLGLLVLLNKIVSSLSTKEIEKTDEDIANLKSEPDKIKENIKTWADDKYFHQTEPHKKRIPAHGSVDRTGKIQEEKHKHYTLVTQEMKEAAKKHGLLDEKEEGVEFRELKPAIYGASWLVKTLPPRDPEKNKKTLCKEAIEQNECPEYLYQRLVCIHPFNDYNGRTFRAFYHVMTGYPLFLRNWNFDYFLSKEQFRCDVQESRLLWFKIMLGFKKELMQNKKKKQATLIDLNYG